MDTKSVSAIFDPEPLQWGLRGDPFLWEYLKEQCKMCRCLTLPKRFEPMSSVRFPR